MTETTKTPTSEDTATQEVSPATPEHKKHRRAGGRERRDPKAKINGPAYIQRNIPSYDVMGEENLLKIEAAADKILAEVGLDIRDDDACLALFKKAGAKVDGMRVKFEPGMLREILKTAPKSFTQHARNPHARCKSAGVRGVRPGLWLALRHGPGQGPALRDAGRLPELNQARLRLALAAPLRRHGLRAHRHAGQQTPPGHGLCPHPLLRQAFMGSVTAEIAPKIPS